MAHQTFPLSVKIIRHYVDKVQILGDFDDVVSGKIENERQLTIVVVGTTIGLVVRGEVSNGVTRTFQATDVALTRHGVGRRGQRNDHVDHLDVKGDFRKRYGESDRSVRTHDVKNTLGKTATSTETT